MIIAKRLIKSIALFIAIGGLAQDSKISIDVTYPLPISGEVFSSNTGIIDIGFNYVFYEKKSFGVGASLSGSAFTQTTNDRDNRSSYTDNTRLLQSKIFGTYIIGQNKGLRPFIGIGYTFAFYNIKFDRPESIQGGLPDSGDTGSGININAGATLDVSKRVYVLAEYDHINLSNVQGGNNLRIKEKTGFVKFGIGYRL